MAEEKKSRGESAMGGKKSKPSSKSKAKSKAAKKKRVHEIHLRRADSGEMLAKHKHVVEPGEMPEEDTEHVVPEGGLQAHADEHLPAPGETMPQAAPSPAPAAPMGM